MENERDPMGKPIWWHHHGIKLSVMTKVKNELILESSAAKLSISFLKKNHWEVCWEVGQVGGQGSEGTVILSSKELREAFDYGLTPVKAEDFLFTRYGATAGRQGKFIRTDRFLNIPCPGTGNDGDPNISILITTEIKEAVKKLLK